MTAQCSPDSVDLRTEIGRIIDPQAFETRLPASTYNALRKADNIIVLCALYGPRVPQAATGSGAINLGLLRQLREAFDGDSAPHKNIALRKAYAACDALLSAPSSGWNAKEAEPLTLAQPSSDQLLNDIVDWTWIHATEGAHWPSAKTTADLIRKAKERGPTQEDAGCYIAISRRAP
jgi:hypothetical protein